MAVNQIRISLYEKECWNDYSEYFLFRTKTRKKRMHDWKDALREMKDEKIPLHDIVHTMIKGLLKGVDDSNDDITEKAVQSSKEVYL